jgi:hypothetical protein
MKLYLAAMYSHKTKIAEAAKELTDLSFKVTSTWFKEPWAPNVQMKDLTADDHSFYARRDLQEIEDADLLVFFSEEGATPRGGRHVEFGYALRGKLPILVIGPKENIFHYTNNVFHVATWDDAKAWLLKREEDWKYAIYQG